MQLQPFQFEAIGTKWEVYLPERVRLTPLQRQIMSIIDDFDRAFSRFRPDSLVTKMSQQAGRYTLPESGDRLLTFYRQIYDASEGRVTPLIGQVMHDSGYDASYSLKPKALRTPPAWDEVMQHAGDVLILHKPALLDFGAAGKGLLVDVVGELLEQQGIADYLVNAGGDIRSRSTDGRSYPIGLEDPVNAAQAVGVVQLQNDSLCGSAGNRRAWQGYHHIIDPVSLASPRHLSAVWTTAQNTMLADGMSTCLYFIQPEKLLQRFEFEYAEVFADGSFEQSSAFPGNLFEKA